MPADESLIGQNEVDVRNEARRAARSAGPDAPPVSLSAAEYAQLRYVVELIVEYEPGTRGATLGYIKEQASQVSEATRG